MNKYIIEAIGTFFLVLTISLSGNPLAIGLVLTAMVYMGGYISGGHYNPAVSIAVHMRGKVKNSETLKYILSQLFGSVMACLVYAFVNGNTFLPKPGSTATFASASLLEILFTFALCSVVLHTATSQKTKGNEFYGLAIGITVMAAAYSIGSISGGVLNPAVAVGAAIVDMHIASYWPFLLLYIFAPWAGAVLAGIMYKIVSEEK